jgi:PTH1 family peptidyl-tRNA hydrolase
VSIFARGRSAGDGDRFIVAGLGNPGERYEKTRHNLGARVVELLVERMGTRLKRHKSGCLVAEGRLAGSAVVLARPTTYMNDSGRPLARLMRFYKQPPARLLVVHDELDLAFGVMRVKSGGGTAGHNGVASLVAHLHSKDFLRLRIGVGRPPGGRDPVDYVLSQFTSTERGELELVLQEAAAAVERVIEVGAERAMNELNTRPRG